MANAMERIQNALHPPNSPQLPLRPKLLNNNNQNKLKVLEENFVAKIEEAENYKNILQNAVEDFDISITKMKFFIRKI